MIAIYNIHDMDMDMDMDSLSSVNRKQGFTLLELSIVLVIIGLIIGGITAGADLIRSAELQNVLKERKFIATSIRTFELKYNALPGDMDNATAYWGAADNNPTTCQGTEGSGTETCNGDGDGRIDQYANGNVSYERHRFWQHLANSGIISGNYKGVGTGAYVNIPGAENTYQSKLSTAYWMPYYKDYDTSGNPNIFDSDARGNMFRFGALNPNAGVSDAALTPAELFNIDTKVDDGKPARGTVFARFWNTCTTAASSADLNADYLLSESQVVCAVNFRSLY